MKKSYAECITVENLLQAWNEFAKGKRKKQDVREFERNLEDNLFALHKSLADKTYRHGNYKSFYVNDPKRRHIHKASVADRVVHHLLYTYLYELFDKTFIHDSYSCRLEKGTHRAVKRLETFVRKVSRNYTKPCFVLHCDIKKFFASVDHGVLFTLLQKKIADENMLQLLFTVIDSFHTEKAKGIPLGNLTSQVFANIYMHELDQFVKQEMKIPYYIRYADDFVIVSNNKTYLYQCINTLQQFLFENLHLTLHPDKIIVRKLSWGVDFLGYIVLPHYILPRTKTKRRMFQKLQEKAGDENFEQSLQSYLGYLSHANAFRIAQKLKDKAALLI
ncbi:MAG TPA: reverse transcriptase/maturase family protein [Candidatus Saccharimonadales bacterium]|nr:reverse transcriptase/maturase family protein [Candidatus Saccharimonadales bacterium]